MNSSTLSQGVEVIVSAFRGKRLRRRVWEDIGTVVLICTEEEYQRALRYNDEATCSGFPKEDIVEVLNIPVAESARHDRTEETQTRQETQSCTALIR